MSSTILKILADPSNAVFCIFDGWSLQSSLARYSPNLGDTAPSAPTTTGITLTLRSPQHLLISHLRS